MNPVSNQFSPPQTGAASRAPETRTDAGKTTTVNGDSFEASTTSFFAQAATTGKENSWDLEALKDLIKLMKDGRIRALPGSNDYVNLELVSEAFGSNKSGERQLFLATMAARNQHVDAAAKDPQSVIQQLLQGLTRDAIQDPSRVMALVEGSNGDPEAAVAALNREFPTGWEVIGRGKDMRVAFQGNGTSWPNPVQVHYQRHGADSFRVTIGGHGRDERAHAFSMIVTEGGKAHVIAPQRLDFNPRLYSAPDGLEALSRAIASQAPIMSLDEKALRQTRPDLAGTLDQKIYLHGIEMRLGDALELKLQEGARWAVENHLEPAALRESPKDPRWAILSAMANRYLPGKVPGRSGLVTSFFEGQAHKLEQEMDELAAMAGDPPFRLREAVEESELILRENLYEVFDAARGDTEELQNYAMARGWQLAADSMPGESDSGGTLAAVLTLIGIER